MRTVCHAPYVARNDGLMIAYRPLAYRHCECSVAECGNLSFKLRLLRSSCLLACNDGVLWWVDDGIAAMMEEANHLLNPFILKLQGVPVNL